MNLQNSRHSMGNTAKWGSLVLRLLALWIRVAAVGTAGEPGGVSNARGLIWHEKFAIGYT